MSDPRADLRAAVKRLLAAIRVESIEVMVFRKDIEVLMAVNAERVARQANPNLHPAQR